VFRIVNSINGGEVLHRSMACAVRGGGGVTTMLLALSQSGRFLLRVENAMLVLYEWRRLRASPMIWKEVPNHGTPRLHFPGQVEELS